MTRVLSRNVASPWNPRTAAMPMRETRYGSSPNVSSTRPHRGSRATSTTGVSAWCVPLVRASAAVIAYSDSTSSGLNVAPRPIGCENDVPSRAACPCRHSSWNTTGMPNRDSSMKKRWIALVSSAICRAFNPGPASLGLPTCPRPFPCPKLARALATSKRPSASTSVAAFCCHTHRICAAFSSSVILARRSATRCSAGRSRLRYAGNGGAAVLVIYPS